MTPRRLVGATVVLAAACALAPAAGAQTTSRPPGASSGETGFLTRYRFHLDATRLGANDPRFVWDADFGGDLDFVDYGKGRISALVNFETILGDQYRSFDPNQGNYTLDLSASLRQDANEVALVFHHVSRHLSDRPKPFPIDWNMAGVRFMRRSTHGRLEVTIEGRALGTIRRSYVDYTAEVGGGGDLNAALSAHVTAIVHGDVYGILVEKTSTRKTQNGGSVEAGVRLRGAKGAVDLVVGYERRVDAGPFDFLTRRWFFGGFRLVSAS